ncbi:DUF3794 domain-containing protein [Clostridium tarantellae]|uniref:DUF3794 domain-containing protein n=1 Tax=Clostridium tarantellae TaxID=39493 RepID=A0A6I1MMT6_9CLOT|nr:DUF3794 domain-containing protein [Clostridium tarantellae]MPQ44705.1 DUF3794 domain-containing protein [Clostridium tarantellae]
MVYNFYMKEKLNKSSQCDEDINASIVFNGLCSDEEIKELSSEYWVENSSTSELCIPKEKPFIESIYSLNGKIKILKTEVIMTPALYKNIDDNSLDISSSISNLEGNTATGRKLIIIGHLNLCTTYTSKTTDESISTLNSIIPFSSTISLPYKIPEPNGTDTLEMDFYISHCIKNLKVISFNHCCICICYNLILKAIPCTEDYSLYVKNPCEDTKNYTIEQEPVIYGLCPLKCLKNILSVNNSNNTDWQELFICKHLTIPPYKLDICQILSVNSYVNILCKKIICCPITDSNNPSIIITDKKLALEALLNFKLTYIASNNCHSIHSAHFTIPFSALIPVSNPTNITDRFKITNCIEYIYVSNLNCREIFLTTLLMLKVTNVTCRI